MQGNKTETGTSNSGHPPAKVWQPGVDGLDENEQLQFDPSVYDCLHAFNLGWPCLSFDFIRDELGLVRNEFPHTLFCVAGTQAANASDNSVVLARLLNITGTKRKLIPTNDEDVESDSSSSDEDDDETGSVANLKGPVLQGRLVPHQGGINRVRAMQQQSHIIATWGDNGYVQVWDMGVHLQALSTADPSVNNGLNSVHRQAPLHIFTGHKDEGFALDWSAVVPGRLVSGDCKCAIHLWEPTADGKWSVESKPFLGHKSSVEDLQWSPTEQGVFASCSVDTTIGIWDVRRRDGMVLSVKAHDSDVNVISWNRLASCMLASGSDDGTFRIWDLRSFKEDSFVAHFKYHKQPITSIEWSSHEASTIGVTSADNQLTIWDLSLERDAEEEAEFQTHIKQKVEAPEDLPPQLLFVHQGQNDMKELHWHAQIPGLLMSTAADGFNVLKPTNMENLHSS
ncbi:hypothetical protein KP509_22G078400 [Ceratopteris richardii]|uniref:Glutamate-rich WD repeat-containing protein 1 n=1 Tax=Ceratopteris richardii TaxID=49495 RepID=A0A8T2S9I0_CERRI|nr:hypothetical protein KP509_22G078400 [Ceratopteris richardii]